MPVLRGQTVVGLLATLGRLVPVSVWQTVVCLFATVGHLVPVLRWQTVVCLFATVGHLVPVLRGQTVVCLLATVGLFSVLARGWLYGLCDSTLSLASPFCLSRSHPPPPPPHLHPECFSFFCLYGVLHLVTASPVGVPVGVSKPCHKQMQTSELSHISLWKPFLE